MIKPIQERERSPGADVQASSLSIVTIRCKPAVITETIFLFYFNVSDKSGPWQQVDRLELDHLSLALLLSAELEVLGSLDGTLILPLAISALQPQHKLLGGLRLLPQDGLRLTTESLLLAIVPASTLGLLGLGRLLVLGHLHLHVLVALGAEGVTTFGHVNHGEAFL